MHTDLCTLDRPRCETTCLRDFQQHRAQTNLLSYRRLARLLKMCTERGRLLYFADREYQSCWSDYADLQAGLRFFFHSHAIKSGFLAPRPDKSVSIWASIFNFGIYRKCEKVSFKHPYPARLSFLTSMLCVWEQWRLWRVCAFAETRLSIFVYWMRLRMMR